MQRRSMSRAEFEERSRASALLFMASRVLHRYASIVVAEGRDDMLWLGTRGDLHAMLGITLPDDGSVLSLAVHPRAEAIRATLRFGQAPSTRWQRGPAPSGTVWVAVVVGSSVLCNELTVEQLGELAASAPASEVSSITRTAAQGGASN